MADWLTHVLAVYVVLQLFAWQLPWLRPPFIVVGMAGGLIPDLAKIGLLIPNHAVTSLFGVPFSWDWLTTLPGSLISAGILALLVDADYRFRVFGLFVLGIVIHRILDVAIITPGPTRGLLESVVPELYLSTHLWPSVVTSAIAVLVFALSVRRSRVRG